MTTTAKVQNGDVTLPVTRSGAGRKLIFFNGIAATQVIWNRVMSQLKGKYEIITFDFRGHCKASATSDHSFGAFLSDAETVMGAVGADKPIVVAWSFGADLAVTYAAAHPDVIGGLVIIDGALPISEPLVDDEKRMRRVLNSFSMKLSIFLMQATAYRYSLSGNDIADIAVDVDRRRQHLLDVYAKVDCPMTMVLATKTAGENTTEHAKRNNRIWHEGGKRLATRFPAMPMQWIDAGHRLPLTKPQELANVIDTFAECIPALSG